MMSSFTVSDTRNLTAVSVVQQYRQEHDEDVSVVQQYRQEHDELACRERYLDILECLLHCGDLDVRRHSSLALMSAIGRIMWKWYGYC